MLALTLTSALTLAAPAAARTIRAVNSCSRPVYPVAFTLPNNTAKLYDLAPGANITFDVPDNWHGNLWARTECKDADASGFRECLTGTCGDKICANALATKVDLTSTTDKDTYFIQFFDGGNVPLSFTPLPVNYNDCSGVQVGYYSNFWCPGPLRAAIDSKGVNYGCNSACAAGWGNDTKGNYDCCTGAYAGKDACGACGKDFYQYWSLANEEAFTWPYDPTGLSLDCNASNLAQGYELEFCPQKMDFAGKVYAPIDDSGYYHDLGLCPGTPSPSPFPTAYPTQSPGPVTTTGTFVVTDAPATTPPGTRTTTPTTTPTTTGSSVVVCPTQSSGTESTGGMPTTPQVQEPRPTTATTPTPSA